MFHPSPCSSPRTEDIQVTATWDDDFAEVGLPQKKKKTWEDMDESWFYNTHRIHGAGIYANIWAILMVNVTIYSI